MINNATRREMNKIIGEQIIGAPGDFLNFNSLQAILRSMRAKGFRLVLTEMMTSDSWIAVFAHADCDPDEAYGDDMVEAVCRAAVVAILAGGDRG